MDLPYFRCSSYIGRHGKGGQSVLLNDACLDKGTVLHELMHAAGFWHEQSRSDRNDFVKIHWDNIIEGLINLETTGKMTLQNYIIISLYRTEKQFPQFRS